MVRGLYAFVKPTFTRGIVSIASSYGPIDFWIENLETGSNPDATWRALLLVGCLGAHGLESRIRRLLVHPESRVRAWACFALGQLSDEAAVEHIRALNADASGRVRFHAWQALQAIVGPEESARLFSIHLPPSDFLILVSEDDASQRRDISLLLAKFGYRVIEAKNEAMTLYLARTQRPSAILTDNQKGRDNLSGLNMTWELIRNPITREALIFMLTQDFIEPIFLWSGGDLFLNKTSAAIPELCTIVNEYLHH